MALRQRDWARRVRGQLRADLGGKCDNCPATDRLQFDCIIPQGKRHHRQMNWESRMIFYRRMLAAGNLRLLCRDCNGLKGGTEDKQYWAAQRTG